MTLCNPGVALRFTPGSFWVSPNPKSTPAALPDTGSRSSSGSVPSNRVKGFFACIFFDIAASFRVSLGRRGQNG